MTKRFDNSVFQGDIKVIDEKNLYLSFNFQNVHKGFFIIDGKEALILKEKIISGIGIMFLIKIPLSYYKSPNAPGRNLSPIESSTTFKVTKVKDVFDINFKGSLSIHEDGKTYSHSFKGLSGIVLAIVAIPKKNELEGLKQFKPKSTNIYNGENNKFKKCGNCNSRTFTGYCLVHNVTVSSDNTCKYFNMNKKLLGGLPG